MESAGFAEYSSILNRTTSDTGTARDGTSPAPQVCVRAHTRCVEKVASLAVPVSNAAMTVLGQPKREYVIWLPIPLHSVVDDFVTIQPLKENSAPGGPRRVSGPRGNPRRLPPEKRISARLWAGTGHPVASWARLRNHRVSGRNSPAPCGCYRRRTQSLAEWRHRRPTARLGSRGLPMPPHVRQAAVRPLRRGCAGHLRAIGAEGAHEACRRRRGGAACGKPLAATGAGPAPRLVSPWGSCRP
jgi:hypothetical protein